MTKTENQKSIAGAQRLADLTGPDSVPEGLDKVRDILFGGQMRAVETRLQSVEERLLREQQAMHADFNKRLAAQEADVKRELQSLGEKLAAERAKRTEELKALASDLRDALRSLEKRHVKLEEMTGSADAELRDSILRHSSAVAAEIERLSQRLTAELNREVHGLRKDKVDIASLAGILTDMAGKLGGKTGNGGGRAAAKDGPRS